jgi:hypothetical protein
LLGLIRCSGTSITCVGLLGITSAELILTFLLPSDELGNHDRIRPISAIKEWPLDR